MRKLILFLAVALLATGCISEKRCQSKYPPETIIIRTDSVFNTISTIYKDTLIYIHVPGEVVFNSDTIIIDKFGFINSKKSHLQTTFADSWAWIENNRLKHELRQNDTLMPYKIDNAVRLTWERAERFFSEKQQTVVKVKYIPTFYKITMWGFFALLAFIILEIVIKIKG